MSIFGILLRKIPPVAASEKGGAQTSWIYRYFEMSGWGCKIVVAIYLGNARSYMVRRTVLERPAREGDSPVRENQCMRSAAILEYCPVRRLGRKQAGLVR